MSSPGSTQDQPQWIAGILVLVALTFLPVVRFGFVYDDGWILLANGFLRVPEDAWILLSPEAVARGVPDAFRPTEVLLDIASYHAFGLDARAHHALSLGLHLGVCILLERWLGLLGVAATLRLATVAIFGTLAIHAEAVAVVSFREDLLACFLGLLAGCIASCGLRRPASTAAACHLAALALMALAVGAKHSAAMLPGLWFLGESWIGKAPLRRRSLGLLALAAGAGLAFAHTWHLYGALTPYGGEDNLRLAASRIEQTSVLARSLQVQLETLGKMALPIGLSPEYRDAGASFSDPRTIFAALALLAMTTAGLLLAKTRAVVGFAMLGTPWLLLPTSNLVAMPNMQADRFAYMPSLTVCVLLAAGVLACGRELVERWPNKPMAAWAPLVTIVLLQGGAAQAAASHYASDSSLWQAALQRAPDSPRTQAMAGLLLVAKLKQTPSIVADRELLARAEQHCQNAEALDPEYELPQLCFARLAILQRQWARAHDRLQAAWSLSWDRSDRILAALAEVALDGGAGDLSLAARRDRALGFVQRGLRRWPYSPELHAAAGKIFHRLGEPDPAWEHYRRASRLRPERWELRLSAIELALDQGRVAGAEKEWKRIADVVKSADPIAYRAMQTRLEEAENLFPPPIWRYLFAPELFPPIP